MVADRQQAAKGNQQHQWDPGPPGRAGDQLRGADAALLVARHVSPGVGPANAGASRHDADPDNDRAHGGRAGVEYALPVDGGAQKTANQQVERAEHVGCPFLDQQQRCMPQSGNA